ncbi:MAG: hypothetical protein M1818_005016 [Claussenomyces sp. TS43310]|nr:MAG: hypothetical protein M1818_005016 [Claussenomyces sp. TS43310]
MNSTLAHPSWPVVARKFGRSFERFDLLPTASLSYRALGKVKVDCRFRQSKSLWGVLGDAENPAGIIYMDLCFDQPKDCKLSSATILVTLEEDDSHGINRDSTDSVNTTSSALQMTDRYGPKQLSGEQKVMPVKKTYHGTPQINVLGNGGGGLGVDVEQTRTYTSRWSFTGQLQPGKDKRRNGARGTTYRTIKWELGENDLESRAMHSNVIHTGFAFEHEGKPCYLRVEIDGKLQRTKDRFMKHLKFPSEGRKEQGSTLTWIGLSRRDQFERRLDGIADGLPRAMELENYTAIPMETPDALPASFQEVPTTNGDDKPAPLMQSAPPASSYQKNSRISPASVPPLLDAPATVSDPLIDSLTRALNFVNPPQTRQRVPILTTTPETECDVLKSPSSSESSTLVEQVSESRDAEQEGAEKARQEDQAIRETFLRLSQSPALLLFVQLLASFLDLFGKKSVSAKKLSLNGRGAYIEDDVQGDTMTRPTSIGLRSTEKTSAAGER